MPQTSDTSPSDRSPPDRSAADAVWRDYCAATGVDPGSRCDVYAFGDSPALADELLTLVLDGPKRATAGLVSDFERDGEELPVVGGHAVVLDGRGDPRCVLRTTDIEVRPMNLVDERFAWDEGEGDRSLSWWLDAHRRYFTRTAAARGETFDDAEPCVFERFELVWPKAD